MIINNTITSSKFKNQTMLDVFDEYKRVINHVIIERHGIVSKNTSLPDAWREYLNYTPEIEKMLIFETQMFFDISTQDKISENDIKFVKSILFVYIAPFLAKYTARKPEFAAYGKAAPQAAVDEMSKKLVTNSKYIKVLVAKLKAQQEQEMMRRAQQIRVRTKRH